MSNGGPMSSAAQTSLHKRSGAFKHILDTPDVARKRKITWNQIGSSLTMSQKEADYDAYLRKKWSCTEAIPKPFDPEELEAIRQASKKKGLRSKTIPPTFEPEKVEIIRQATKGKQSLKRVEIQELVLDEIQDIWASSHDDNEVIKAYTEKIIGDGNDGDEEDDDDGSDDSNDDGDVEYDFEARERCMNHEDGFRDSICSNSTFNSDYSGISITGSLNSEDLDGYDSEVTIGTASVGTASRASSVSVVLSSRSKTPEATPEIVSMDSSPEPEPEPEPEPTPTLELHSFAEKLRESECEPARPRTGNGSKPPLSRSAFSTAGLPCPKGDVFKGQQRSETLRAYPRAPGYFPFQSVIRR